ncbi:unnamed protein product [Durusdinium trenchii]|uniref:E3 ubiquitin-protein ligase Iruka n=2 Tax=Durusdinium trenchii TaxID=1381693 RepID=A0ABP0IF05_9DINO
MSDLWAVLCGLLVFALMMGILWVDFRRLGRSLGILGKATELDVERWIQNQLPCVHTDGELMCAICLDQLQFDERVKQLPCQHCYHKECLMTWGSQRFCREFSTSALVCPLCRQEHIFA